MNHCPNCHNVTDRNHTWLCAPDDTCILCGNTIPAYPKLFEVIRTKCVALEGELKILRKMFPHTLAFDAQLRFCRSLMADIEECNNRLLSEQKGLPEDEQVSSDIRPPCAEPTRPQAGHPPNVDEGDDGAGDRITV